LSNFQETSTDLDEVECLIKKEIKLVQYQYKSLFESIMNKEAYQETLKAKLAE